MTPTLMPNHFNTHLTQIGHPADEGLRSSETSEKPPVTRRRNTKKDHKIIENRREKLKFVLSV